MTREGVIEVMARAICVSEEVPADEVAYTWEDGSMMYWETYIPAATAALAALEAAGVRLVPSEATAEMVMGAIGRNDPREQAKPGDMYADIYRAMLAASPYRKDTE